MNIKNTTRKSNLKRSSRNGRPSLPEAERQSIVRHTRYNEAENAVLLDNMRRAGLNNVSEYIRRVTLNPKIVPRMSETEMTIARHLSGMSIVNLSRIKVIERNRIIFGRTQIPVSESYKDTFAEFISRRTLG